ncbi:J domain-containing protein [Clostridium autoethanogenum]|uniref:DnaJ domain-containing protein n=1 Tax=Clostridium autoethanogenum DSM 10061 TaxID=1341692 RepID=A0ABN4BG01_9CLOT|nr:DnaJ domain-containing protein [Clostridium autoethanogenum]AGY76590.1 DnaJ domain-containing protein [Clostridium autoethanogenum DSM 10061]ALU36747.1 Heat shock protein DnaJ domain protein [Clostridium autoethanogenum DSM 10061]OVY50563.1 Chaperone protein DnaJ [Clostridium autoethanogenum]
MKNPYEVLEINENASKDEIKKAYRTLAKKYHPDQYGNNPLKDLAEDKMRDINEAYDYLMKNEGTNTYNNGSSDTYTGSNSSTYQSVENDIYNGNLSSAESKLMGINTRDAEWHYLMGILNTRKGWYDQASTNLSTACSLDPNNFKYQEALNKLRGMNNSYRQPYYDNRRRDPDICNICATLYCLDCLCGGGNC